MFLDDFADLIARAALAMIGMDGAEVRRYLEGEGLLGAVLRFSARLRLEIIRRPSELLS